MKNIYVLIINQYFVPNACSKVAHNANSCTPALTKLDDDSLKPTKLELSAGLDTNTFAPPASNRGAEVK